MADISELLNSSNPDSLQKLIDLRNQLSYGPSASDPAAAKQMQTQDLYDKLFGNKSVDDSVQNNIDSSMDSNLANKSASDSADVLQNASDTTPQEKQAIEDSLNSEPGIDLSEAADNLAPAAETDAAAEGAGAGILGDLAGPIAAFFMPASGMADTSKAGMTPVPGMPGKYFQGEDIVNGPTPPGPSLSSAPNSSDNGPSNLFSGVSGVYGNFAKQLAANTPSATGSQDHRVIGLDRTLASASTPNAQQPSSNDVLGNLINSLYGNGAQNKFLAAQNIQQQAMLGNAMNMAGKEIAAAMSRGGYKPNYADNQALAQTAALPVQQQLQQRALADQALNTGLKLSDYENTQKLTDPNSAVSQVGRQFLTSYFPSLAKAPGFNNLSYQNIKDYFPVAEAQMRKDQMLAMMGMRQQNQETFKQNAAEQRLGQDIETSYYRGGNRQALQNEQLADRIIDLDKNFNPNDPDSVANARIVLNETMGMLSQAASGGVQTEYGTEHIYPRTAADEFSKIAQALSSTPQGYNIKPFLDQAVKNAQVFKTVSQNYEKRTIAPLLYGARNNIRPEVYQHYKDMYHLTDNDINNAFNRTADVSDTTGKLDTAGGFTQAQEAGITRVMQDNPGVSRDQAIQALRQAGKL